MKRKFLKVTNLIFCTIILVLGSFLTYMTITDYKPEAVIQLEMQNQQQTNFPIDEPFSITTFNIGYGGLDAKEDFFMDGGTNSRASSLEQVTENLKGIGDISLQLNSDFYFFQEVDKKATRSFKVNEVAYLSSLFPTYGFSFGQNYLVSFVPVPITKPHGQVDAGLLSFSKYTINQTTRLALAGEESWPIKIFELDRSMLEQRIALENGKELILLNVHLSAYDKGGIVRKQQLQFIEEYVTNEYASGNYIILGGDFNHSLPTTDPSLFPTTEQWPDWLQMMPEDFLSEQFYWAVDSSVASSRTIATSYTKGENFLSIIDGFLVSNNIELLSVYGTNLEFKNSDHNPVTATFQLK